jgi:hypothetical protein
MMGTEISGTILGNIRDEFNKGVEADKFLASITKKVNAGQAVTFTEAHNYSVKAGRLLGQAMKKYLSAEVLADGKIPEIMAEAIFPTALAEGHTLVSAVASAAATSTNQAAGIGLKAITPAVNKKRVGGFVNTFAKTEFEKAAWMLDEPVVNFCNNVVDETVKLNAQFQQKSGLSPYIVRTAVGSCCEWCEALAGKYDVDDAPDDIYRRHERCRCTVVYKYDGKAQNVHSKLITLE